MCACGIKLLSNQIYNIWWRSVCLGPNEDLWFLLLDNWVIGHSQIWTTLANEWSDDFFGIFQQMNPCVCEYFYHFDGPYEKMLPKSVVIFCIRIGNEISAGNNRLDLSCMMHVSFLCILDRIVYYREITLKLRSMLQTIHLQWSKETTCAAETERASEEERARA